jgi:two-component system sensor histidine kinase VicK
MSEIVSEVKTADQEFNALMQIGSISVEGVVIYSFIDEKVLYANSNAHNFVGLQANSSRREIESILSQVVPQDREYLKNQYSTIAERAMTGEVEFQILSKNGQQMFLCCNAFLINNQSALVVFVKDITKSKKHEDYLVEYGARKNTALDTLAHHISGALNLMHHLSTEAGRYVESSNDKNLNIYLGLLNNNSRHCLEIIYDLLKKEHLESSLVSVKNSRIEIVDKIFIIYEELVASYPNRKFIFKTSTESLHINTDEIKLLQVVNNLTSNAIKFSLHENEIVIEISETKTEVIVGVKDSGIGIPDDLKPYIFQDQFRAGRTGLNGERSIGLGLSICNNLVRIMKGKMWFHSEEGRGSAFYFDLPKMI